VKATVVVKSDTGQAAEPAAMVQDGNSDEESKQKPSQ